MAGRALGWVATVTVQGAPHIPSLRAPRPRCPAVCPALPMALLEFAPTITTLPRPWPLRLSLWVGNLGYVACTYNAAQNKAGYAARSVLRPPRHPSSNALAGFGLPLHNLASAFTVLVCLGILFSLYPPAPLPGSGRGAVP
jgi:hypothetical protein